MGVREVQKWERQNDSSPHPCEGWGLRVVAVGEPATI